MSEPVLPRSLRVRLALMMFLQYAAWGAWLPLLFPYLHEHRGFGTLQVGLLAALGALGAVSAPFVAGQLADRWLDAKKLLALCHGGGALLMLPLGALQGYGAWIAFAIAYSLLYAPTLSLTNAIALAHLRQRDRDFSRVRLWGTVGWIAAGMGMAHWLRLQHAPAGLDAAAQRAAQVAGMADAFRASAGLSLALAAFALLLPATPPRAGAAKFAPAAAWAAIRRQPLRTLFLVALPTSCMHQLYFAHAESFLGHLNLQSGLLQRLFGSGGGGLMTIGQMSEIAVLGLLPLLTGRWSRKTVLALGLSAYCLRFAVFAFLPTPAAVLTALGLHGLCFGAFIFVAFLVVDEHSAPDARASAQSLFNLVLLGLGVILGNLLAGWIGLLAQRPGGGFDYRLLFGVPCAVSVACLLAHLCCYPRAPRAPATA